jgi:hypothetical protein
MNAPYGSDQELGCPWSREDEEEPQCNHCKGVGFIYEVKDWNDPQCPMEKSKCEYCNN